VKISTFGDLEAKPEPRPLDPERLATKRNEMNDWLSSQLTVLGEREEAVNRRDDELRSREEMLSRWEREALERVEEMEKKFQTALTNVMDELARQEKVLPDFYKSIGADRSSVAEWLKPIKECEARIDELERERAGIRRAIKEARDALGQHGSSG
jgi:chromosome segregation ATPase